MIRVMSFQCVKNHISNILIDKNARTLLICRNVQVNIKITCSLQEEHSLLTGPQIVFMMVVYQKNSFFKVWSEISVQSTTKKNSHLQPL